MEDALEPVSLVEVSPRDGLQNEARTLSTEAKTELVVDLVRAGARRLEVTSFVSPRAVPQLADADELMARLSGLELEASMIGLVLNQRGAERACAHRRIDEVNFVVPCTDAFGRANQQATTAEAVAAIPEMARTVHDAGKSFSVTLAVAFGCPYEGRVPHERFIAVLNDIAATDLDELALADTLGCAVPGEVASRFEAASSVTDRPLRAHFHDTRRTGLANVWAAYGVGVRRFDASTGGVGGCPFAPGAAGNVATEDVAWMLEQSAISTGVNANEFAGIGRRLCAVLGSETRSGIGRSGFFPPVAEERAPVSLMARGG